MGAVVLIALALRVAWVLSVQPGPTHDAKWYYSRAKTVASFHALTVGGRPTAYRPPLYPVVLGTVFSVTGSSLGAMRWLNVIASVLSVMCLFVVTKQLTASHVAAGLAAGLFAIYPTDIAYTSLALSEPLFNLFMLGAIASALMGGRPGFMVSAVCCCAAMLTRAQGALLAPLAAFVLVEQPVVQLPRRKILRGVAFLLFVALLALPYWIRNTIAFGAFVPISNNGGVNLFIGNNPQATGGYRFDKAVSSEVPRTANLKALGAGGAAEQQIDHELSRLARSYMFAYPVETIRLWPAKLRELYTSDMTAFEWNIDRVTKHGWIFDVSRRAAQAFYLLMWTLAAFAVPAFWLHSARLAVRLSSTLLVALLLLFFGVPILQVCSVLVLALLVVLFPGMRSFGRTGIPIALLAMFTASQVVYFGDARFHHPMMPWIGMLAGTFLASVVRALNSCVVRILGRFGLGRLPE